MYKKLSLFLALILIAIIVAACATPQADADNEGPFDDDDINIAIDKVTGCQYVVYDRYGPSGSAGGITPRLNAGGDPICLLENQQQ